MRVLAIDASLRNCGVAIVDGENGKSRALFFGTIHNPSSLKSSACLVAIRDQLAQLIREHEPDCCALEAVIYVQSYKTAILLGVAELRPPVEVSWLGRVNFADALKLQEKIVAQKRSDPDAADTVLLLEHDPIYTIGRTPDQSSLRGGSHLPHPFFQINRGGQATYHGPGQLMSYPIIDLRRRGQDW